MEIRKRFRHLDRGRPNAFNSFANRARLLRFIAYGVLTLLPLQTSAGAELDTGTGVQRLALIIASADYDLDKQIRVGPGDAPKSGQLKDLKFPCNDAKLFKEKLIAAKWSESEIISPPCNISAPDMSKLVDNFREKIVNSENLLAILYFSGHGAQFEDGDTSHSFIFGAGAKYDLNNVANSLKKSPRNTSFLATHTIDIHDFIGRLGIQDSNAVLVILDACRENPLYGQIEDMENAPFIQPLSSADQDFPGIVVAYSTPSGVFSGDGFGNNSIYTGAFANLLSPEKNLDSLLNKLRGVVARDYRKAYPNRKGIQEPVTRGRFTGDWCVWNCPADPQTTERTAAASLIPGDTTPIYIEGYRALDRDDRLDSAPFESSSMLTLASFGEQFTKTNSTQLGSGPTSPPWDGSSLPRVEQIFEADTKFQRSIKPQKAGTRFDIFWCDGPSGSERLDRARLIANALTSEAKMRQSNALWSSLGPILSVRVRRLDPASNAQEGFRFTDDVVLYDQGNGSEEVWASLAASIPDNRLSILADKSQTDGYLSIFICQQKPVERREATVTYLQVSDKDHRTAGSQLLRDIVERVPTARIARGVEVRPDGPRHTELRFFHDEDRDTVFQTAKAYQALTNKSIKVQFLPELAATSTVGHMEMWLGRDDSAQVGR